MKKSFGLVAQLGTFASAAGGGSSEQKGVAAAPMAAVRSQPGTAMRQQEERSVCIEGCEPWDRTAPKNRRRKFGLVAQLGERSVRIREVEGSNPFRSTKKKREAKASLFFLAWGGIRSRPPKMQGSGAAFLGATAQWAVAFGRGESLQVHKKSCNFNVLGNAVVYFRSWANLLWIVIVRRPLFVKQPVPKNYCLPSFAGLW